MTTTIDSCRSYGLSFLLICVVTLSPSSLLCMADHSTHQDIHNYHHSPPSLHLPSVTTTASTTTTTTIASRISQSFAPLSNLEGRWRPLLLRGGQDENPTTIDLDESSPHQEVVDGSLESAISSDTNESKKTPSSSLFTRLADRVLPAVFMLAAVGGIAHWGKEDGLIYFTLLVQVAMYGETTRVIGGDFAHGLYRWYWFLIASIAWNGPQMMPWWSTQIAAVVSGMTMLGIISSIIQFQWKQAQGDEFRDYLRQAAVSSLSATLVVLPSSYWIATMENFGKKWVGIPALLVIINDTMAYVFGKTMGRHPILSVISPNKTWEGFIGAAFSTLLASYYMLESQKDALVFGSVVSLIGPFGGFLASLIKRAYMEKDFGSVFRGHGGFVDRLDCQLILAPLVFLYLTLQYGK